MKPAIAEKQWGQFAPNGFAAGAADADDGAPGEPLTRSVGGALWIARPSVSIALLSALVAAYLAAALAFAGLEAWSPTDLQTPAFAGAALLLIALATQVRWAFGVLAVMAASFYAQYQWALLLDPQPFGEFAQLWELARSLAAGLGAGVIDWTAVQMSPSPTATGVFAVSIWLLGDDFGVARLVASGLWTAQILLLWSIAREISELRNRAFAVALIFGLSPTVIVFGSLPSVEAVFGLFSLSAIYLMLTHRRRGLLLSAFLSGLAVGLAFLTQPAAAGFALALVALIGFGLLMARGWKPRLLMAAALASAAAGAAVGYAPQVALNYQRDGALSVEPGPALGYQLLLGTNRESGGGYSFGDLAEVGFVDASGLGVSPEALEQAGREAQRIAIERISADPGGFALFAATDKLRRLWGSEREMLSWSVGSPSTRSDVYRGSDFERYAPLAVAGAYLAILVAAFAGAARLLARGGAVTDPARWFLLLGAVVGLALAFTVLEARERHHLAFAPLLALLAPLTFARLPWIARDAEQMEASVYAPYQPEKRAQAVRPVKPAPAAAAPKPSPAAVAKMPVEDRLAVVLKGMSKPPRPPEDEREPRREVSAGPAPATPPLIDPSPATAASEAKTSSSGAPSQEAPSQEAPSQDAPSHSIPPLVATPDDRIAGGGEEASSRRIPPVLAPPATPQKKHSAV